MSLAAASPGGSGRTHPIYDISRLVGGGCVPAPHCYLVDWKGYA